MATRVWQGLCLPFRHDTFGSHGSFGGRPIMRTTILAYAIALVGLITMALGVWGFFSLVFERKRVRLRSSPRVLTPL